MACDSCLLYIAATNGWPFALYYDQQIASKCHDVSPELWTVFWPQQRMAQSTCNQLQSATHQVQGKKDEKSGYQVIVVRMGGWLESMRSIIL
jgi:hypothetical protein